MCRALSLRSQRGTARICCWALVPEGIDVKNVLNVFNVFLFLFKKKRWQSSERQAD